MSNPNPETAAMSAASGTRVGYIEEQLDQAIHAWIKGQKWVARPLTQKIVFVPKAEAVRRTGLTFVTLWSKERKGEFPPRYRLGPVGDAPEAADAAE
jgi:hypothetical protein